MNDNFIELTTVTTAEVERFEIYLRSLQDDDRNHITSELKKLENNEQLDQDNGFSNLVSNNDEYIEYTDTKNSILKRIFEDYPALQDLDEKQLEEKFISAAKHQLSGRIDLVANSGVGNCSQIYDAEVQSATASSIVMLVGCGAAGGATANPVSGGAIYGLCSGAVYSWLNAQLSIAEAEYENCINED